TLKFSEFTGIYFMEVPLIFFVVSSFPLAGMVRIITRMRAIRATIIIYTFIKALMVPAVSWFRTANRSICRALIISLVQSPLEMMHLWLSGIPMPSANHLHLFFMRGQDSGWATTLAI
ncbi:hypothetical protein, partial [uncultured Sutterella sp.]|uniref:hypothetical protein n=1 Tax=uncultured Sutterella sp. TaxID=286133 RepID=UPI002629CC17